MHTENQACMRLETQLDVYREMISNAVDIDILQFVFNELELNSFVILIFFIKAIENIYKGGILSL